MNCVHLIFSKIDKSGKGSVSCEELKSHFNVASHPRVISGSASEDEVFLHFLTCFPDKDNVGHVSYTEWCDYYAAVSLTVDLDEHFA